MPRIFAFLNFEFYVIYNKVHNVQANNKIQKVEMSQI